MQVVIEGTLLPPSLNDPTPVSGYTILLYELDNGEGLASSATDSEGAFSLSADIVEADMRCGFAVLRDGATIMDFGRTFIWTLQYDGSVELRLPEGGVHVFGTVRLADGQPQSGLSVSVLSLAMRGEPTEIGSGSTGSDGAFAIDCTASSDQLDIQVTASRTVQGSPVEVARSEELTNVPARLRVDLVVGNVAAAGTSEFATISAAIEAMRGTVDVSELTDLDMDKIAARRKVARELVQLMVEASATAAYATQLAGSTVKTELFYGLGRAAIHSSLASSLSLSADERTTIIESALARNVLPAAFEDDKVAQLELLSTLRPAAALTDPSTSQSSRLAVILSVAGLTSGEASQLLEAYDSYSGTQDFWVVAAGLSGINGTNLEAKLPNAKAAMQYSVLTLSHPPMVKSLWNDLGANVAGVAAFAATDWVTRMTSQVTMPDNNQVTVGVPSEIQGNSDNAKRSAYATALVDVASHTFPMQAFRAGITALAPNGDVTGLTTFLDNHSSFDFDATSVTAYERNNPNAFSNNATGRAQMLKASRLWRLAPTEGRYAAMRTLWNAGYDSARSIALSGRESFVAKVSSSLGGESVAIGVYERARQLHAVAATLALAHGAKFHGGGTNGVLAGLPSTVPDWETLFGSLDYCACEACQSVFSPSAYLTDVLHFLSDRPADATPSALDVLKGTVKARRPDLTKIELSCINTNRVLPQIDLINEQLELRVAPPEDRGSFSEYQTTWTAEELAAHPEHLRSEAYGTLMEAVYPWQLPFHLPVEETRAYVAMRGPSFDEVIAAAAVDPATNVATQLERLGLTTIERNILIGRGPVASTHDVWDYWGATSWVSELSGVAEVLARSGMTYDELCAVVATRYVSGAQSPSVSIAFEPGSCDLSTAWLEHLAEDPSTFFDRLHRFERLRRKIGWTAHQLDRAIAGNFSYALERANDSSNRYLSVSHDAGLAPSSWSLELWVWNALASTSNPSAIVVKTTSSAWNDGWGLTCAAGGAVTAWKFWVNDPAGASHVDLTLPANEWSHVVLTFGSGSGQVFVNGESVGTFTGASPPSSNAALVFFQGDASGANPFPGKIRSPRFYAKVLSSGEAAARFVDDDVTGGLVASWPMRATGDSTVFDEIGSRHGVPHDLAWSQTEDALDTQLLVRIGHSREIAARTGCPLDDVLTWREGVLIDTTLDAKTKRSPYDVLFQAGTVGGSAFALNTDRDALLVETELLQDHIAEVAAGLATTSNDVTSIIIQEGEDPAACNLTLSRLSTLYRYVTLSRALKLSVPRLLTVLRVSGRTPFAQGTPDDALRLLDDLDAISSAKTSAERLEYLLHHRDRTSPDAPFRPTSADVTAALAPMWTALATRKALPEIEDPDGVAVRRHLGRLVDADVAAGIVDIICASAGDSTKRAYLAANLGFLGGTSDLESKLAADDPTPPAEPVRLATNADRYSYLAGLLADYVARLDCVTGALAKPLGVSRGTVEQLVYRYIHARTSIGAVDTSQTALALFLAAWVASNDDAYEQTYLQLLKAASIIKDLKLADADLPWVFAHGPIDIGALSGPENLLTRASSLDHADWTKTSAAISEATERGPSGAKAWILQSLNATSVHCISLVTSTTSVAGSTYVLSAFLKEGTQPHAILRVGITIGYEATFDLANGIVTHRDGCLATIDPAGDAWFRCSIILRAQDVGTITAQVALINGGGAYSSYTGDGNNVLLSVPQLEIASRAGEPVATNDDIAVGDSATSARDSFASWQRLVAAASLRSEFAGGALFDLLEWAATTTDDPAAVARCLAEVSRRTGWSNEDLATIAGMAGFAHLADFADERALLRIRGAISLMRRLGLPAAVLWGAAPNGWSSISADPSAASDAGAIAADVKKTVRGSFDAASWLEKAKPVRNGLRKRQRDALVAYLVGSSEDFSDANDVSDDLLMDVLVSPCAMTSRIKHAMGSAQLFVQRIFLNFEDLQFSTEDHRQWQWMKNYRVWEANRRVFMYPENWIEPELRDDKTPEFEKFEQDLQKQDLTSERAEDAVADYLGRLATVARLQVMATHLDVNPDTKAEVFHVVARTRELPHAYYYRARHDDRRWTPWKKLELEIEGDHLLLGTYSGRLTLLWGIIGETAEQTRPSSKDESSDPLKLVEVRLKWATFDRGRWGKAQQARGTIPDRMDLGLEPKVIPADLSTTIAGGADLTQYSLTSHLASGEATLRSEFNKRTIRIMKANDSAIVVNRWMAERSDKTDSYFAPWKHHFILRGVPLAAKAGTPGTLALSESGFVKPSTTWVEYQWFCGMGSLYSTQKNAWGGCEHPWLLTLTTAANVENYRLVTTGEWGADWVDHPIMYDDDSRAFYIRRVRRLVDALPVPALPSAKVYDTWSKVGGVVLAADAAGAGTDLKANPNRFLVQPFYHPFVGQMMEFAALHGVDALLNPNPKLSGASDLRRQSKTSSLFDLYAPNAKVVHTASKYVPHEDFDFTYGGAYSQYNWELFFHAPMLAAKMLATEQRFEDALKWYQYVFNPAEAKKDAATTEDAPQRYWKIKPLFELSASDTESANPTALLLALLARDGTAEAEETRRQVEDQVAEWRAQPFSPHAIARLRPVAYQKTVVMKYLDTLIAWGDQLFGRNTIESINEATLLYVTALRILGKRPTRLPPQSVEAKTYDELSPTLGAFSDAVLLIEEALGPSSYRPSTAMVVDEPDVVGVSLYFCVPPNDKLLAYWDTIEDRLFKIRNCLNLQGIYQQLPLFEPPIDPGLLVAAKASGVDVSTIIADMSAPVPNQRYTFLFQKAVELASEVRGFGGALLAALEKRDAEALASMRGSHEVKLQSALRASRQYAINEAERALEALEFSLEAAQERRAYYGSREYMNSWEAAQMLASVFSAELRVASQGQQALAAGIRTVPDFAFGAAGWAASPVGITFYGGSKAAAIPEAGASVLGTASILSDLVGQLAGQQAAYRRRQDDWDLQKRLAEKDCAQIGKQIEAATVRLSIAERELENLELQLENSREALDFMTSKYTNEELYNWMLRELTTVYSQSYRLAFEWARRAERAYQFELADKTLVFVEYDNWDSLRMGLLAGERLSMDLRRMDAAYHERNRREYELTRHIALSQLDPYALQLLRETGCCYVDIPEAFFDQDTPGHCLRRIRRVSVTVPCAAGPFTPVRVTLTLSSSRVRIKDSDHLDDSDFPAQRSIVTSSGRDDGGLFDAARDERYMPFEGAGAISTWRIELPTALPEFDYRSITDLVLHMQYTARDGENRSTVEDGVATSLDALTARSSTAEKPVPTGPITGTGPLVGLSVKSAFPDEWYTFLHDEGDNPTLVLSLDEAHLPMLGAASVRTVCFVVPFKSRKSSWTGPSIAVDPTATVSSWSLEFSDGKSSPTFAAALATVEYSSGHSAGDWTITCTGSDGDARRAERDKFADDADDLYVIVRYHV